MPAATLRINIVADASKASTEMNKAAGGFAKFGSAVLGGAVLGKGVDVLGDMAKAAAEDQQAQALLAAQLRTTTGASDAQVKATEDWIAKQAMATGVADDQLRPALATLVRATGDVSTAQAAMSTALDVSAGTGKDVESVAAAMAKGYAGNTAALGKLVPGLDSAVLKTKDMHKVTDELARTMGGQAAVKADSAAGKYQRLQLAISETKEGIGSALLPVLGTLAGMLGNVAGWISQNTGLVTNLVIGIGGFVAILAAVKVGMMAYEAAMAVVKVATMVWTGIQWALNSAFLANPLTWIVLAIVALVAAIVIAYKKSDTFRAIVQATWNGIKVAALFVWNNVLKPIFNFIVAYYKLIWSIAVAAARWIVQAWNWIKDAATTAWNWIKVHVIDPWVLGFKLIVDKAKAAWDRIKEIWAGIKGAISDAWNGIKGIFDNLIGKIEDVIGWFKKIKIPDAIGNFLGKLGIGGHAAAAPSLVAGPSATTRSTRTTTTTPVGTSAGPPIIVNVYLDGQRVSGLVDRVITRRLNAEGAALAAGAWG